MKSSTRKNISDALVSTGLFFFDWLSASWLGMLVIGGAHASDSRIPAFGFVTVALLCLALAAFAEVGQASSFIVRNR